MKIALATAVAQRDPDPELGLIRTAVDALGHEAEIQVWDDEGVDWAGFDAVIVRSCWDYTHRREQFLVWTRSVPRLHNPTEVIAWNTDKVYLRELAGAGIPVIETHWDVCDSDDIGDHDEWVCKPSISAGSRDTARWSTRAQVYEHSAHLIAAGRTSMVQPYVASVDDEGETAMLFIGGEFSHAIRKGQLLRRGEGVRQGRDSRESISRREPSAAQLDVAEATIAAVPRIDGEPQLIELELAEPSLFLAQSNDGAIRLAEAVIATA